MEARKTQELEPLLAKMREENPRGAFVCDLSMFCQILRLEARQIQRMGIKEYVLLLTLQGAEESGGAQLTDSQTEKGMELLATILEQSLRSGDVITRCSARQFLVMLACCTYEATTKVAQRLQEKFENASERAEVSVQYELEELPVTGTKKV